MGSAHPGETAACRAGPLDEGAQRCQGRPGRVADAAPLAPAGRSCPETPCVGLRGPDLTEPRPCGELVP